MCIRDRPDTEFSDQNILISDDPLMTHVVASEIFHPLEVKIPGVNKKELIHPSAVISKNSKIGRNVIIGPKVVIYDGVHIGENSVLHAGTVIMSDVVVGTDCVFYPNSVVQDKTVIGNRVVIQSGSVIGADGHGYFQREGVNQKIPQVGRVVIENFVVFVYNTTVDRARFTDTVIKAGSKIDNQVQIAHNVVVGENALISAQSAIGGSATVGHHLILGGQTGIRDNVQVGNHVTAVARSVITTNIADKQVVGGMPSRPVSQWRKTQALIHRLEELFDRLKNLESRLP